MKENSIEEDIKKQKESLRNWLAMHVLIKENSYMRFNYEDCWNLYKFVENALIKSDDYKRVLKENEELTISNKEIDKECSRLERKEVELEKIIDLMAKEIDSLYTSLLDEFGMWSTRYSKGGEITTDEIKQYFINKAKEVK